MTKPHQIVLLNLLIIVIGGLLFIPFLGDVNLFDWDEVNFAESSREMLLTKNYFSVTVNFEPFWEKPPLFNWMQVLSMTFFGVNEFAARFPNAIIGIVTLVVLFNIGRKEFDYMFGLFWVMCYACSILPHFYFKSGIIDPTFNLFIFLGLYFLAKTSEKPSVEKSARRTTIILAGLFIGLAILTKGPVAYLIIMLCTVIYLIYKKSLRVISILDIITFTLVSLLVSFAWFGVETVKNGTWFIEKFIQYQIRLFQTQDAGHGGPFYYHFLVLLLGCFPASIYVFRAFSKQYSDKFHQRNLKVWMVISLLVVLVLFSIVKTKIVHYSSFCYFPLTFLAAYTIQKLYYHKLFLTKAFSYLILIFGGFVALVFIAVPIILKNKEYLSSYIQDDFTLANLKADVSWSGYEFLIGAIFLLIVILVFILNYKKTVICTIILYTATLILVQSALVIIVPKIEGYIQEPVISFYKNLKGKDVYVDVFGYKSYGQLFYTDKQPRTNPESNDMKWLLDGKIDKPVYLVSKIGRNKDLESMLQFKKIGEQAGYIFYKRMPQ